MNCEEYQIKYREFTNFPLAKQIHESEEYESWHNHRCECESCEQYDIEQQIIKRGHKPSDFPCLHIAYQSTTECKNHSTPWECPNIVIVKTENGFGIPIRDGGSSYIQISHCPWCGIELSR